MFWRYLWFFLLVGCTSSTNNHFPPRDGMLQFADEDLALPAQDMAQPEQIDDLANVDLTPYAEDLKPAMRPDLAGTAGSCGVKVNELLLSALKGTTSKPSEEYVEL